MKSEAALKSAKATLEATSRFEWFGHMARHAANWSGKPVTFLAAVAIVIVWAITGPIFHYSDTWQLVINTGTTIVTFLMVFLIQNTQNRDTMAVQLKLSELILAAQDVENRMALAEDMSEEELERLHAECKQRADETLQTLNARLEAKKKLRPDDLSLRSTDPDERVTRSA